MHVIIVHNMSSHKLPLLKKMAKGQKNICTTITEKKDLFLAKLTAVEEKHRNMEKQRGTCIEIYQK